MGNTAEEKKVSVAQIGEELRQAREKKGLTIEQAQKQTHIHSKVLAALEDGRCDGILAPNYVKSFLKEYSRFLGFDHQKMVGDYLALHPELKNKNINLNPIKSDQKNAAGLANMVRLARTIIVSLLLVSLAVFAAMKATALFKNKKSTAVKSSKITSSLKKNSQKKTSSQNVSFAKNVPFTMTLKVNNPVMVQLKKDGVVIFKRVLPKGTEETFNVNKSVDIFVGRGEAIEIVVNGKSLGSPGRGVIRDIEVTSNGIKIR
jgi:cytoskeletal protein RodZ